jgi:hypothetical protein
MLAYGWIKLAMAGPGDLNALAPHAVTPLSTYLILHAFATGCTALTGIEAISNGVPSFKTPETKNASRTLIVMAILMSILFVGSIGLTQYLAIIAGPDETILSALARRLLGDGPTYLLIQASTMMILAVAANTSFSGFPRLAAILAADGYLPRPLTNLGDRLVFANGIIFLSVATGGLILAFGGDSHSLVPLFAIGVFMAFTLSQAGMVLHWMKNRQSGWQIKGIINGFGALTTAATVLIIGYSKFIEGAWITIFAIPILVLGFEKVNRHYQGISKQLSLRGVPPSLRPLPAPRLVIPVSGVHRGTIDAMNFASAISKDVTAVYIELEPENTPHVQAMWKRWFPDTPLIIRSSPYRSVIGPLLDFLDETDRQHHDGQLAAIVLPEFIPAKWWHGLLHNQTSWLIKTALLYRRRQLGYQRVIIDIPYHLRD